MEKRGASAGRDWQATVEGQLILDSLTPVETDRMLAAGWTRSGKLARTFTGIQLYGHWYDCVMLRLPLRVFFWKKRLRKLLRRNEGRFQWEVRPYLCGDEEKRLLWSRYKTQVHGWVDPPEIDLHLFRGIAPENFRTRELIIRDGGRLVAFSVFDQGLQSIASLEAAYDPEYQRFSPGLYSMLLEIRHAQAAGMELYYPGFLPRNYPDTMFEYKLRPGNLHFFRVADQTWQPMECLQEGDLLFRTVLDNLRSALPEVAAAGFSGALVALQSPWTTAFPRPDIANFLLFLEMYAPDRQDRWKWLLTWDPLDRQYLLFPSVPNPNLPTNMTGSAGYQHPRPRVLPVAGFARPAALHDWLAGQ
ncbi:MAG: hypothetical protein RLY31_2761 [Bacteroidota bacterium]